MIWLALALMTVVALAIAAAGLRRKPAGDDRRGRELAVYRRQLAELEAERAEGLIAPAEAEAARIEIERRMLRADAQPQAGPDGRGWPLPIAAAVVALGVAAAIPLYLSLGRPDLEGASASSPTAAERVPETAAGEPSMAELVERLAARMEQEPERLEGWRMLGRSALNTGRPALAAEAFARAVELAPDDAELHAALGEALVALAEGQVTAAARLAFGRALERDPSNAAARYYGGLAAMQAGEIEHALEQWKALLAQAPEDAPWRPALESQVARLERTLAPGAAPPLDEQARARARDMSPEDRRAMIVSMVERLAQRLEDEPEDYRGWIRLAQARIVLGDEKGAKAALARAQQAAPEEMKEEIERQRARIGN